MKKDFITAKQIIDIEKSGRFVHVYPRKHDVLIDGFKYYKINQGTLNKYKYYKKHGFLVS